MSGHLARKRTRCTGFVAVVLGLLSVTPARADNTVLGGGAGAHFTTGQDNTGVGYGALHAMSTGWNNSALGRGALFSGASGDDNVAVGCEAIYSGATGLGANVAVGASALGAGTGGENTAVGYSAMANSSNAAANTAVGAFALTGTRSSSENVGVGDGALYASDWGMNTAIGYYAIAGTTASADVAVGAQALYSSDTGDNTAIGTYALLNELGSSNVAIGHASQQNCGACTGNSSAGAFSLNGNRTGNRNTAVGAWAFQNVPGGDENTAVGANTTTGTSALTNTGAFGYGANPTQDNTIIFGNAAITKIWGYASFVPLSDARFKKNVRDDVPGLAFISKLQPVTYNWDMDKVTSFEGATETSADPVFNAGEQQNAARRYTGFLAQQVEAAADQIGFDFSGVVKPDNERARYHLAYSTFVVPLVKGVQEQERQLAARDTELSELRAAILALSNPVPPKRVRPAGLFGLGAGNTGFALGAALTFLVLGRKNGARSPGNRRRA